MKRLNREESRGHVVNETIRKIQEDLEVAGPSIPQSLLTTRGDIIFRNATTAARLAAGTSGQYLQTKGSSADPVWATLWQTVIKTADETIVSDVTLSDDAALTFAVLAATKYRFNIRVHYTTPATADIKMTVTGPAAPTLIHLHYAQYVGDSITIRDDSAFAVSHSVTSTTTFGFVEVMGLLHNGANAGSITLQWAQDTTNVGNTTVHAGSMIEYSPI